MLWANLPPPPVSWEKRMSSTSLQRYSLHGLISTLAQKTAGASASVRTDVRALQNEWDDAVRAVSRSEGVRLAAE